MNEDELRAGISSELLELAPKAPALLRKAAAERIMGLVRRRVEDAVAEARVGVMKNFGAV